MVGATASVVLCGRGSHIDSGLLSCFVVTMLSVKEVLLLLQLKLSFFGLVSLVKPGLLHSGLTEGGLIGLVVVGLATTTLSATGLRGGGDVGGGRAANVTILLLVEDL